MEEGLRKSFDIMNEAEKVIEDDVKDVENNYSKIDCTPIRNTIYSVGKLVYDVIFFYRKCEKNN